ncbi:possible DNA binding protein [Xanthomonas phage Xp15]|uniref:Possible DNA binding protein n=1 Tax=Xanthomonas phage Xp15 TaxID=322855 RepID=Q52PS5_9CAUD|nr:DNA binding protein [Xanthomonas phage Xp15]AAX84883.1 possible DNA binding protein [Xanthomonas phage Xp15]
MNIFILDYNPVVAAQMLCDKHVVKMALESAQMLSSALSLCGVQGIQYDASDWRDDWDSPERAESIRAYRPTHRNHPCTKWAMRVRNYQWLREHAEAICHEHTYRYGTVTQTSRVIEQLPKFPQVSGPLKFALAMDDVYKQIDPVKAYQAYYRGEKSRIAVWTKRETPEFMHEN